jgi:hypothetical protein
MNKTFGILIHILFYDKLEKNFILINAMYKISHTFLAAFSIMKFIEKVIRRQYMDLKSIEANVHSMGFSDFNFINNQGKQIPFKVLEKPISECKIAFISSGGFHLKTEEPFDTEAPLGDLTFRRIPSNSTINELSIAHSHYNHKYVLEDLNCALPLEILKQLEEEKSIGKLAEVNYSFCGFILNLDGLKQDLSMRIAQDLQKQQVDAVILAPV